MRWPWTRSWSQTMCGISNAFPGSGSKTGCARGIDPGAGKEVTRRNHSNSRITSSTASESPLLARSEEHTSELQSPCNLVCRLLLEKKKNPLSRTYIHRVDCHLLHTSQVDAIPHLT